MLQVLFHASEDASTVKVLTSLFTPGTSTVGADMIPA